jgi:hypothetical protein
MIDTRQPDRPGGQHAVPRGDSTDDPRDEYHYGPHGNPDRDEARALAELNRELQAAIGGPGITDEN